MNISSRLSLLSFPFHSPDHNDDDSSGCSTPPFHIPASVPFKWEEEPGKPIPCTALIHFTEPISLHLTPPPRMLVASLLDTKPKTMTKTKASSPTTVFDGLITLSPERGFLGPMVMSDVNKMEMGSSKKKVGSRRRLFGSWTWRSKKSKKNGQVMSKRDVFGGSFVFPSSASGSFDDERECCSEYGGDSECVSEYVNVGKMKKSRSLLSLTQVML